MPTRTMGSRRPQGKALVGVLLFVVGVVVGGGALLGLRVAGWDPTAKLVPIPETKKAETPETEDPVKLKELEVRRLLSDAKSMRARLNEEQAKVAQDQNRLEQQRSALEKLQEEIEKTGKQLSAQLTAQRTEKDLTELKNTKRLARIWAAMEPEEVYKIAKELPPELVTQILYSMSERQAAPVIAGFAGSGADGAKLASTVTAKLQELRIAEKTAQQNASTKKGATP